MSIIDVNISIESIYSFWYMYLFIDANIFFWMTMCDRMSSSLESIVDVNISIKSIYSYWFIYLFIDANISFFDDNMWQYEQYYWFKYIFQVNISTIDVNISIIKMSIYLLLMSICDKIRSIIDIYYWCQFSLTRWTAHLISLALRAFCILA